MTSYQNVLFILSLGGFTILMCLLVCVNSWYIWKNQSNKAVKWTIIVTSLQVLPLKILISLMDLSNYFVVIYWGCMIIVAFFATGMNTLNRRLGDSIVRRGIWGTIRYFLTRLKQLFKISQNE